MRSDQSSELLPCSVFSLGYDSMNEERGVVNLKRKISVVGAPANRR